MELKTVKISEMNYKTIYEYAGELQKELGEPVSIDKALSYMFKSKNLSDLAGTWKMTDKEAEEMTKTLRKGWHNWKIKSV